MEQNGAKRSWMDENFMMDVLHTANSSGLTIDKFDVTTALSPGNNYISEIYRVIIETSDHQVRSVIVKCLPTAEYNLKFIADSRLFEKETLFYSETLPAMYNVEAAHSVKLEPLAPECFYSERDSLLLLEDLNAAEFKMPDRLQGLTLDETVLAVEALARFHALTLDLPDLEELYPDTLYCGKDFEHASRYVANGVTALAAAVETWPGCRELGLRLRETARTAHSRAVNLLESKESPVRVLNHGDFWTNNIMFRRDACTGRPVDVRLLDFQMLRYGSPALDLQILFNTSVQEVVRHDLRDTVLKRYHDAFSRTCKRIGRDTPISLEQLHAEMERNAFFGFLNACLMLPVVLAERGQPPDLGHLASNPDAKLDCHCVSRFRKQFQRILTESRELL